MGWKSEASRLPLGHPGGGADSPPTPTAPAWPPPPGLVAQPAGQEGGAAGGGDEQNSPEAVRLCCVQKIGSSPGTLPHSYAAGGRGDLGGKAGPTLLYGPQACYTPLMPVLAMTKTARP